VTPLVAEMLADIEIYTGDVGSRASTQTLQVTLFGGTSQIARRNLFPVNVVK